MNRWVIFKPGPLRVQGGPVFTFSRRKMLTDVFFILDVEKENIPGVRRKDGGLSIIIGVLGA